MMLGISCYIFYQKEEEEKKKRISCYMRPAHAPFFSKYLAFAMSSLKRIQMTELAFHMFI